MRKLKPLPWSTVAVLAILAALIMTGHNGVITTSLTAVTGAYLVAETWTMRRRPPNGS
jgi:hypothetical protein